MMMMKNSNDAIKDRTRDLPVCSVVASTNCVTTCRVAFSATLKQSLVCLLAQDVTLPKVMCNFLKKKVSTL